jgi:hypothetical protein
MGNIVASSDGNLKVRKDGRRYTIAWSGHNRKGRLVGSGTYLLQISVKDQNGDRKTEQRLINVQSRK